VIVWVGYVWIMTGLVAVSFEFVNELSPSIQRGEFLG